MTCACGNEARYVDENGELTCALCPLKQGHRSVRIVDVPAKLRALEDALAQACDQILYMSSPNSHSGRPKQLDLVNEILASVGLPPREHVPIETYDDDFLVPLVPSPPTMTPEIFETACNAPAQARCKRCEMVASVQRRVGPGLAELAANAPDVKDADWHLEPEEMKF